MLPIKKSYIAIDLKSFYASVECQERDLDPMEAFLVVADPSRTSKTICLAVSPALKSYGIGGRPRLFEVEQKVKQINAAKKRQHHLREFAEQAFDRGSFRSNPGAELAFVIAPPQMAHYIATSTKIYECYLKYIDPEDIHVYSIDEVFIDATPYMETYGLSSHDLARKLIRQVLETTGITATAGIGTNLYLAKIAMDIVAKHCEADVDGVRIAELTEESYRKTLWTHRPISDFWRVGKGYARKLEQLGLFTMGDVARCSLEHEKLLFKEFGVNAELLIDHAWGYEPCEIRDIKSYQPEGHSLGSGQVLQEPYPFEKALLVAKEMGDTLSLDLFSKNYKTKKIVLHVGYDIENLSRPEISRHYHGPLKTDIYGRTVPKPAHGTLNLNIATSSAKLLREATEELFKTCVNPLLLVRRITLSAVIADQQEEAAMEKTDDGQLSLFDEVGEKASKAADAMSRQNEEKENKLRKAILSVREKFGKNALFKGMNIEEGATGYDRNNQIGGHKA